MTLLVDNIKDIAANYIDSLCILSNDYKKELIVRLPALITEINAVDSEAQKLMELTGIKLSDSEITNVFLRSLFDVITIDLYNQAKESALNIVEGNLHVKH